MCQKRRGKNLVTLSIGNRNSLFNVNVFLSASKNEFILMDNKHAINSVYILIHMVAVLILLLSRLHCFTSTHKTSEQLFSRFLIGYLNPGNPVMKWFTIFERNFLLINVPFRSRNSRCSFLSPEFLTFLAMTSHQLFSVFVNGEGYLPHPFAVR